MASRNYSTGLSQITGKPLVTVAVGQVEASAWREVEISRSIESVTPTWSLLTDNRDVASAFDPGLMADISIGGAPVVTGYIDRTYRAISPNDHAIRIVGRGKCADLLDTSFIYGTAGNLQGLTIAELAARICKPYDIGIVDQYSAGRTNQSGMLMDAVIPRLQMNEGRSPFELLSPITAWAGCLMYEAPTGDLILSTPAWGMHSGVNGGAAIEVGRNVLAGTSAFSADQRFSEYHSTALPSPTLALADDGRGFWDGLRPVSVLDKDISRYRPFVIVEPNTMPVGGAGQSSEAFADARVRFEAMRRWGRSRQISVTVDSWTDAAGNLWEPNALCSLSAPQLGGSSEYDLSTVTWLIVDVTYRLNARTGTTCDLVLMPQQAFTVEPQLLLQPSRDANILSGGTAAN